MLLTRNPELCQDRNPCTGEPACGGPSVLCRGTDGKLKLNFSSNLSFLSQQHLNAEEWSPCSSTNAKSFVPWEQNSFAFVNPEQQYAEHKETNKISWKRKNVLPSKTNIGETNVTILQVKFSGYKKPKAKIIFLQMQHCWGQKITLSCKTCKYILLSTEGKLQN